MAAPLLPRLRHAAQRQHAAVRAAHGHRRRRAARGVLRVSQRQRTRAASRASTSRTPRDPGILELLPPLEPPLPADAVAPSGSPPRASAARRPTASSAAKMMWAYLGDFLRRTASREEQLGAAGAGCTSSAATRSPRRSRCGARSRPPSGAPRTATPTVEPVFHAGAIAHLKRPARGARRARGATGSPSAGSSRSRSSTRSSPPTRRRRSARCSTTSACRARA